MKKIVLLLLLPLFAFTVAHKFYVSVTNINYNDKDKSLQITSRIFIDDLEQVLAKRYDLVTELNTPKEDTLVKEYIEKYIKAKFVVSADGTPVAYNFIGKKYDKDVMICYLEVTGVDFSKISSLSIENEILTDLYDEQQNIVHLKYNGKKKSFVLIKGNTKGMLNL